MAEPNDVGGMAQLGGLGVPGRTRPREHPPLRDPDFPAPFAFEATHILAAAPGQWLDHPDAREVMFIDRWGYTKDAWELGTRPPFVWRWSDCRSTTGQPYTPYAKYPRTDRRLGLDTELRPTIDRYRDLLPHEKESRPPFFATHELYFPDEEVMVIEGRGYTSLDWEAGRSPAFLVDGDGALCEFPDGRVLAEDVEVHPLDVGYGVWWDDFANIGRVALITPLGVQVTPWTWRPESSGGMGTGDVRTVVDGGGRRMLAEHLAGMAGERMAGADLGREWIARRLCGRAFGRDSYDMPRWEVRAPTVATWLAEAHDNPSAARLAAVDYPWLPTHEAWFDDFLGDLSEDVMVVGHHAFVEEGWRSGDATYVRADRVWRSARTEADPAVRMEAKPVHDERVIGWLDLSTRQRCVFFVGCRGVEELTVGGRAVDWMTHDGRQALATVIVAEWLGSGQRDPLSARLTAEAWLATQSNVAWTATRDDFLATIVGGATPRGPAATCAAAPDLGRSLSVSPADHLAGLPPLGPML